MASHKARRQGYFTRGRSGSYTICTPNGVAFAETAREASAIGPVWPVRLLGSKVVAFSATKADVAISKLSHRKVAEMVVPGLVRALFG